MWILGQRWQATAAYSFALVMWAWSLLTCLHTAHLTVSPMPSTTPFPWEVAKKFQMILKSCSCSREYKFENKNFCLKGELAPSLNILMTFMSGHFDFKWLKMYRTKMYTLCFEWLRSSETRTILSVDSESIHACAVNIVDYAWLQCADWISLWLAMVAFSEKSTCRMIFLPSHLDTAISKQVACLRLT